MYGTGVRATPPSMGTAHRSLVPSGAHRRIDHPSTVARPVVDPGIAVEFDKRSLVPRAIGHPLMRPLHPVAERAEGNPRPVRRPHGCRVVAGVERHTGVRTALLVAQPDVTGLTARAAAEFIQGQLPTVERQRDALDQARFANLPEDLPLAVEPCRDGSRTTSGSARRQNAIVRNRRRCHRPRDQGYRRARHARGVLIERPCDETRRVHPEQVCTPTLRRRHEDTSRSVGDPRRGPAVECPHVCGGSRPGDDSREEKPPPVRQEHGPLVLLPFRGSAFVTTTGVGSFAIRRRIPPGAP